MQNICNLIAQNSEHISDISNCYSANVKEEPDADWILYRLTGMGDQKNNQKNNKRLNLGN